MNKLVKQAFFKKLADYIGSYKCPECGFDTHTSEKNQPDTCPRCGEPMITAQTSETHVNS